MKRILFGIIVTYLGVCFAACAMQDQFVFYPDDRPVRLPADAAAEKIEITTDDDETLVAFYAKAEAGCPTFINFHGNAQHLSGLTNLAHYYGRNGVGFLAIAYRGYSGSSGKPTERGVREDARAAYAYLKAKGLEPDEIVIRGFSLGSSVALGLAAEEPINTMILGAPFESGKRLGAEMMPLLPVGLLARNAFRSDRFAAKVQVPVLIIHGDSDRVIPAKHSADLAKRFPSAPERIVVPERGHNDLQGERYESFVLSFISPRFPDCPFFQELAQ